MRKHRIRSRKRTYHQKVVRESRKKSDERKQRVNLKHENSERNYNRKVKRRSKRELVRESKNKV